MGFVTLIVLAYLTMFGFVLADEGRQGLPTDLRLGAIDALGRTVSFVVHHPATFSWHAENQPALLLVGGLFLNSAVLLLAALIIAASVGIPLGMAMALWRRSKANTVILLFSILAISTPSFLLAMLAWVVNIEVHRQFGTEALPPTGFGWDDHLIMPALVLAARPLAQIVQVTFIAMSDVLGKDYIRTARAKGLRGYVIFLRHALRNALVPIVTTLSTSLRFSLASLPVVEFFFIWPGVGLTLVQAFQAQNAPLITDLILSLGLLFLVLNLLLDLSYRILDPRLRRYAEVTVLQNERSRQLPWNEIKRIMAEWREGVRTLFSWRHARTRRLAPLPGSSSTAAPAPRLDGAGSRRVIRSIVGNRILLSSTFLVFVLLLIAVFGGQLSTENPYATHGLMTIEGQIAVPPFKPSSTFPWGSDPIGRDLQALILSGAKLTLMLAFFGTLARVAVGLILGAGAAWWNGSWLDRLVTSAVAVWAAFPATILAMLIILGLGIQQGVWVFIVAICLVGWGELAQVVRGLVIRLKSEPYVEGARALGARAPHILIRHVLPNLLPTLLVLAILEVGGVLMLLAELGFLNIFLGGGFRSEIGQTGRMSPVIYYFSDVPEWGALLANIRDWWRSYPWLAWYPGLFFFLAIVSINLWGEGLRRFIEEGRLNVSRLFNKYSIGFGSAMVVGLILLAKSSSPISVYSSQARQFDVAHAASDIQVLSSRDFQGRETGTRGAQLAADYVAAQMKAADLLPAGDSNSFVQTYDCPVFHLTEIPALEMLDENGRVFESFAYRADITEYIEPFQTYGEAKGSVVGVATGPDPETGKSDAYGLRSLDMRYKVAVVFESEISRVNLRGAAGVLVIAGDQSDLERKHLFHTELINGGVEQPVLYIAPRVAQRLLETAGSSVEALRSLESVLKPGEARVTEAGATVQMRIVGTLGEDLAEKCYNVIGYIPGAGSGLGLDSQVIMVSAYYDGLGKNPDQVLYPGANDNASGVAEMLELARVTKRGGYQPKKTVVFVAWSGGERNMSLSVSNVMNAKVGFGQLAVQAVIELSGVGAGDGKEVALGQGSSYRLVQLFQSVGDQLGYPTTTRGRSPHFGMASQPGFGGRSALTAYVSWNGSDRDAHTPQDNPESIDSAKLRATGETALLALTVLSREENY